MMRIILQLSPRPRLTRHLCPHSSPSPLTRSPHRPLFILTLTLTFALTVHPCPHHRLSSAPALFTLHTSPSTVTLTLALTPTLPLTLIPRHVRSGPGRVAAWLLSAALSQGGEGAVFISLCVPHASHTVRHGIELRSRTVLDRCGVWILWSRRPRTHAPLSQLGGATAGLQTAQRRAPADAHARLRGRLALLVHRPHWGYHLRLRLHGH